MEDNQEILLSEIEKDVRSNADLVEQVVNQETDALRNDQVSFYKEGLLKETSAYLEGELKDVRLYAATKSSHDKLETKKKLLELRGKLVDELFQEVTEELKKFVKSEVYETYLLQNLSNIDKKDTGYFVVRENDVKLMQTLLQKQNRKNEIKIGYFAIGGFRFVDEENRFEYSCTLDEKREEQFAYFRNHSGFKVVESEDAHA